MILGAGLFGAMATVTSVGPTTTPSWIAVGTEDTTGTILSTPAYGTNAAGDLFVMFVTGRLTACTTPTGWTLQGGPNDKSGRRVYIFTRDTRSSGGESGTVSVTLVANSQISTIHTFRNVATSSFVEGGVDAGSTTNGDTLTAPTVITSGNHRLVLFAWSSGNNAVTPIAPTGQTGGTWIQRASGASSTGTNCSYATDTAAMDSGGTISGGSANIVQIDEHSIVGFALIGV